MNSDKFSTRVAHVIEDNVKTIDKMDLEKGGSHSLIGKVQFFALYRHLYFDIFVIICTIKENYTTRIIYATYHICP